MQNYNISPTTSWHAKSKTKIKYDPELDQFRGEILGLNGSADFYGNNPESLRTEFKNSLDIFLEVCEERDINPLKEYSGKFNLRISPNLHYKVATKATSESKSINQWVVVLLSPVKLCNLYCLQVCDRRYFKVL